MGGEGVSECLGLSRSEESWFAVQGELGAVLLIELLDAGSLGKGVLDLLSVLLVDDGQVSSDGLSDELELVQFRCTAWRNEGILSYAHFGFPQLFFCEILQTLVWSFQKVAYCLDSFIRGCCVAKFEKKENAYSDLGQL